MNRRIISLVILASAFSYFCSHHKEDADEFSLADLLSDSIVDTVKREPVPPRESFANTQLRVELEAIYNSDQAIRLKVMDYEKQYEPHSDTMQALYRKWFQTDSVNTEKVTGILDKYGWMGPLDIGDQANSALFLVIQHSDLKTQDRYLPMMRKAVRENKASASDFALLQDRVLLGHGRKQLFGSQILRDSITGKHALFPIEDEPNVNKRRAAVGLEPLEHYVKHWGIEYSVPK